MAGAGVTQFYEVGAGKVLSGLVKRIAEGASGVAIGTPDDVAAFKASRQYVAMTRSDDDSRGCDSASRESAIPGFAETS